MAERALATPDSVLLKAWPYTHAVLELASLGFAIHYLFGDGPHHSPWVWAAGIRLAGVTGMDNALSTAVERVSRERQLERANMFTRPLLRLSHAAASRSQLALAAGVFVFKFVEWYYASDEGASGSGQGGDAIANKVPPPPQAPRKADSPDAIDLPANPRLCPLCLQPRMRPAYLPNGLVFCHSCIVAYVDEYGYCPHTHAPFYATDVQRIF